MNNTGMEEQWVRCSVCDGKTKTMVNEGTALYRFPLFCPRCKQETIISVGRFNVIVHAKSRGEAGIKNKTPPVSHES